MSPTVWPWSRASFPWRSGLASATGCKSILRKRRKMKAGTTHYYCCAELFCFYCVQTKEPILILNSQDSKIAAHRIGDARMNRERPKQEEI